MRFDLSGLKSIRSRQRSLALWLGQSGHIDLEALRSLCKEHECYNSPNFTINMKKDKAVFVGNRIDGWELTPEGSEKAKALTFNKVQDIPEPPLTPTNTEDLDADQIASLLAFRWESMDKEGEVSPSFLGQVEAMVGEEYDVNHGPIRAVMVKATRDGVFNPKDEVLVHAIKDGGAAASDALEILRARMNEVIYSLCVRSSYGFTDSSQQVTEGIWEAAQRFDVRIAREKGATWNSYCNPWLKKFAAPRSNKRAGRGDRPSNIFLEDYKKNGRFDDWLFNSGFFSVDDQTITSDVGAAINALEEPFRCIIRYRFIEGWKIDDIVAELDLSTWQVKHYSKVGKSRLRELLVGYEKV